jgi:hypothetical protein
MWFVREGGRNINEKYANHRPNITKNVKCNFGHQSLQHKNMKTKLPSQVGVSRKNSYCSLQHYPFAS